ncbi:MAG: class I SAM-dependent methyltransferase [Minisyncoccia bacterium]
MDLKDTYNKIAEDWVKDHNIDTWWVEGTDIFLSKLSAGALVLDVGCGGGVKTKYISNKGFKVLGIDFSEKMIEIAKRENPDQTFKVLDVYNIDKFEKTFDGIFAQAVLLHIPKSRVIEVLTKIKSRLNDGGYLYVALKALNEDKEEEKVVKENDYGYEYERFFSYYTLGELRKYFKDVGLEILWEKVSNSEFNGWIQVIGKKINL